jgi:hypothetical protein
VLGVTSVPPAVSDAAEPAVGLGAEENPADAWPAPTEEGRRFPAVIIGPAGRAGELDVLWRTVLATCWIGVFFAFAAVWKASEEIGIATWWLGPRSDPQPLLIRLSPFILALAVGLVVVSNRREAVWVSYGSAVVIGALAALDVSRSGGLALVEFAIAGAVLLVTTASFAGRYRVASRPAPAEDTVQR